jgi:hypothetical protein
MSAKKYPVSKQAKNKNILLIIFFKYQRLEPFKIFLEKKKFGRDKRKEKLLTVVLLLFCVCPSLGSPIKSG